MEGVLEDGVSDMRGEGGGGGGGMVGMEWGVRVEDAVLWGV